MDIIWAVTENPLGQKFFSGVFRDLDKAVDFRNNNLTENECINLFSGTLSNSREEAIDLLTKSAEHGDIDLRTWRLCWGITNLVQLTTGHDFADKVRELQNRESRSLLYNFVADTILPLLPDFVFES